MGTGTAGTVSAVEQVVPGDQHRVKRVCRASSMGLNDSIRTA